MKSHATYAGDPRNHHTDLAELRAANERLRAENEALKAQDNPFDEVNVNALAASLRWEVDRLWPGETVYARGLALSEEAGEVCRAILKRSHACSAGTFKGQTPEEWTENLRIEVFQAIGVLLDLADREGFDVGLGLFDLLTALGQRVAK